MKVRYTEGPDALNIPAARVVVERGEWVDLPDDLAQSLADQGWETKTSKSKAADRGEEE